MAVMVLFEALIAFFCFLTFCYFLIKKHFDYFLIKKHFQSYPWNSPVLGMAPGLLVRIHRIYDAVEVLENSNMTLPFKGPWFAGKDMLVTVDPANIQHIMSSNFSNYIKGPEFQEIFEVFGHGIVNSDAERGSNLKKCFQALLLHDQRFQRFSMSTTTSKLKDVLLPLFNHFSEDGTVVDLQDVFRRFTFDTTLVTVTGSDPRSLSIEMRDDEFVKAFDDVAEAIVYRHFTLRVFWKLQKWIGFGQEKKMVEADAIIDRVCAKYISAKRDEIQQEICNHDDVLTFFLKLDATKYKLFNSSDDRSIRDVILGFILAGRDTMASALSWFFWLLSENPRVTTMIREEINKNLPRTGSDQENMDKLVYLHGALYEAMRLFPPTPFQRKSSIKPDVLPSGHRVDANITIMIFLYAMGRMKSVWGEDAMEFKPERWVLETGGLRHEPSYKFFSFSAGPRSCLGKHIAMTHLKVIVVEILQNYDIEVVKGQKIEPLPGLILHMKHGLRVTLHKRCSA